MAVSVTIAVNFRPVNEFADDAAAMAATAGGELIVRVAQQLVPVDTGALRNSLSHERDPQSRRGREVEVVGTGPGRDGRSYGAFVEVGTFRTRPQPYLIPAAVSSTDEIMKFFADAFFSRG